MPYARRARKATTRKRTIRRRRPGFRRRRFPRKRMQNNNRVGKVMSTVWPDVFYKRMKYIQWITLNPGAGLFTTHVFRANSAYDPDVSTTGHQPITQDQILGVLYQKCFILGSKITVKQTMSSTTSVTQGLVGVTCDNIVINPVSSYSSIENWLEDRPGRKYITGVAAANESYTFKQPGQISAYFSPKRQFNLRRREYMADEANSYTSSADITGVNSSFYNIIMASINGNDPGETTLLVTIDYLAAFTGRRAQGGS